MSERKPRVVVGGGFAGIAPAKSLRSCDADVTLIDRRNHHIFQPLLYCGCDGAQLFTCPGSAARLFRAGRYI